MKTTKKAHTTRRTISSNQLLVASFIWQFGWIFLLGWFEVGPKLGVIPVWLALLFGGILFASAIFKLLSELKLIIVKVLIWLILCLGMAGLAYVMALTLGLIHYLVVYG